jgi:hypothetical protein
MPIFIGTEIWNRFSGTWKPVRQNQQIEKFSPDTTLRLSRSAETFRSAVCYWHEPGELFFSESLKLQVGLAKRNPTESILWILNRFPSRHESPAVSRLPDLFFWIPSFLFMPRIRSWQNNNLKLFIVQ